MVKFWSQIYKKWNATNKIMFWLTILGICIGIFFGGKYVININSSNDVIIIENSSLTNSPVFQRSSNISVTYNSPPDEDVFTPFYSGTLSMFWDTPIDGKKYNFYSTKIILPDNQEAFISEGLFNKSYPIASCNEEFTDCYIHHKYRINEELKEEDICWIFTTRFGHDNIGSDSRNPAMKFYNNPEECIKLVQD